MVKNEFKRDFLNYQMKYLAEFDLYIDIASIMNMIGEKILSLMLMWEDSKKEIYPSRHNNAVN